MDYFQKQLPGGVLWEKVFLEISQNSQENTCARLSFLIKLHAEACNSGTGVFPLNFVQFLRTPFLTAHLQWLLLYFFSTFLFSTKIVNFYHSYFQPKWSHYWCLFDFKKFSKLLFFLTIELQYVGFLLSRPLTVDSMFFTYLKTLIPLVSFYTPWKTSENLWYFKNNVKQKAVITSSQKKQ